MSAVLSPERPLGSTGVTVPLIGYGTAPLGNLFTKVQEPDADATVDAALGAGITFVDTAPEFPQPVTAVLVRLFPFAVTLTGPAREQTETDLTVVATATEAGDPETVVVGGPEDAYDPGHGPQHIPARTQTKINAAPFNSA